MLYSEHEESTGLFIVAEGELRSVREGFDGREQVLSTERTGATLSEVSVFGGGQYFSTVFAETPSAVLCINNYDIRQICEEHPELLWKVAKVLSARVRRYAELIESLALRNIDQRSRANRGMEERVQLSAPTQQLGIQDAGSIPGVVFSFASQRGPAADPRARHGNPAGAYGGLDRRCGLRART
jgi:CRP-like cAMP-binding protein